MTPLPSTDGSRSEIRDGMRIDWDVPITTSDGLVLRADVYRPVDDSVLCPVLLSYGVYGKGLAFQQGYATAWQQMLRVHPDVGLGSTQKYQNWEVADPEKWVPHGYACVRVDSRGCGRSPGLLDCQSHRETQDLYECIEWAAAQAWCNQNVGLAGISYYATNQWRVAALQPPHLAAICVWEGFADRYREGSHHGGILSTFLKNWTEMQLRPVQHGRGERGYRSAVTGELVSGPATLDEEALERNRIDGWSHVCRHALDDEFYAHYAVDWSRVTVPLLSAGNWGGQGLHLRGNVEGFLAAASTSKWLELHGGAHWAGFYTDYGVDLQRRFFDHFLKGAANGWDRQPPVQLQVRHPDRFELRHERAWPLPDTQWTRLHLDPLGQALMREAPAASGEVAFDALGDGVTFLTPALAAPLEITGPSSVTLRVSSNTTDADLFVVLRVFRPDGSELVFQGALDPHTPVGQGWLRASHRRTDPARSTAWRPYHTHDRTEPLVPGEPVDVQVEIWPTCIVVPAGHRIGLTVRGRDYEWDGAPSHLSNMKNPMRGCGPFVHDDPLDRPAHTYAGRTTLHLDAARPSFLLLPLIER